MDQLHGDVVSLLQRCPITEQFGGRSHLLRQIPDHLRDALHRDPGNRLLDFDLIVDQLARLGRQAARAIARIGVPLGAACSYGTGWLAKPGLMMTN